MDIDFLKETAYLIPVFSEETVNEYRDNQDILRTKINKMLDERSDIIELVGGKNLNMMHDNHANHVKFIYSIMKDFNSDVLVETVVWVFRSYCSHGFTTNYWSVQLNSWLTILKETLSEQSYKEVYNLYNWMIINIPIFVKVASEQLGKQLDQKFEH